MDGTRGAEVLNRAVKHQNQCCEEAKGKQDLEDCAIHIYPEISEVLAVACVKCSNECNCNHDTGGSRGKVLNGETGHLAEET